MIGVARRFGEDVEFSRGGGGNASAKADGVLYIKPSGIPLAELTAEVLVPLDMAPLLALLEAGHEPGEPGIRSGDARGAAGAAGGGRRPPAVGGAAVPCTPARADRPPHASGRPQHADLQPRRRRLGRRLCSATARSGSRTRTPACRWRARSPRARAAFEARTGTPAPHITLMQNHGIIVAGDTRCGDRGANGLDHRARAGGAGAARARGRRTRATRARTGRAPSWTRSGPRSEGSSPPGRTSRSSTFDDVPLAADVHRHGAGAGIRRGRSAHARPDRLRGILAAPARPARRRSTPTRSCQRCAPASTPTLRRPEACRSSSSCRGWACSPLGTPGRRPTWPATSTSTRSGWASGATRSAASGPFPSRAGLHRGLGGRGVPARRRRPRGGFGTRLRQGRDRDRRSAGLRPRHRGGPRRPGRARRPGGPQRRSWQRPTPRELEARFGPGRAIGRRHERHGRGVGRRRDPRHRAPLRRRWTCWCRTPASCGPGAS